MYFSSALDFSDISKESFHENRKKISSWFIKDLATTFSWKEWDCQKNIAISYGLYGKPHGSYQGENSENVGFSLTISHSYPYMYGMVASPLFSLGCDVERITRRDDSLLSAFLHENEYRFFDQISTEEKNILATKIWALKESILKAIGCWLCIRPSHVDVSSILRAWTLGDFTITIYEKKLPCTLLWLENQNGFVFCSVSMDKEIASNFLSHLSF